VSWPEVKLSDIFDISSSKRVHQHEWREKGIPFYRAREIVSLARDGYVNNDLYIDESLYEEYSRKYGTPKEGDLLISAVGTLGKTYAVKTGDRFYFKDASVIWLKKKADVDTAFIQYALKTDSVQSYIQNYSGATVGTYTISKAKKTEIPLPPLLIQKHIAATLEKADTLRSQCRQMEQELNQLAQSVFLEMFGDPVKNPKGWKIASLGELASKITDGTHKTPTYTESGVKFLSAKNISSGSVDWENTKFISEQEHNELIRRCNPEVGDVLLAKSGTIGVAAIIDKNFEFSLFESAALIKYERSKIVGEYLLYLLNSKNIKQVYAQRTKGNSIRHLHLVDIRSLNIPVPPLELQKIFCEKINKINLAKETEVTKSGNVKELFNSLMQRAFKGELSFSEAA